MDRPKDRHGGMKERTYTTPQVRCQRKVSLPVAAGERRKDPGKAERGEDDEPRPYPLQETPLIGRRNLDTADQDSEYQHSDAHAKGLPDEAHGAQSGRGDTVESPLHRAHHGVRVGRGEEGESEPEYGQAGDDK